MPRRPTPSNPERPIHTVEQKRRDIDRLLRRIKELEEFDPQLVSRRFDDPKLKQIEAAIDETLASVFGHGTVDYKRYSSAAELDHGPVRMNVTPSWIAARGGAAGGYRDDTLEIRRYITEGKEQALGLLRQAVRGLEEEIELAGPEHANAANQHASVHISRKVFIVHGHEGEPREAVARFLEKIGFTPVILHERANQGQTVIEKVEANSDVGFAIVLLTPDDEGSVRGGAPQPRPRQNVLLELGYFIGKLTRKRVCTLKVGEMEIPSDWRGVIDEPFDTGGGWKQTLARELEAADYEIDWNKVMKT
jgi:predicted nucleotide-binding protein